MPHLLDLDAFSRELHSPANAPESQWRPLIVRLQPGERLRLTALCEQHHLRMIDTIDRQMADLAQVRLPAVGAGAERRHFIEAALSASGGSASFGNWVWLPWESRIAHLLGEDDYFDVITNRNQNKITRAEQLRLRTKRIGVVGLSVGGEAAVTVAQEHLCSEPRERSDKLSQPPSHSDNACMNWSGVTNDSRGGCGCSARP